MSDYNNPNSYDKYGNPIPGEARPMSYEPVEGSGRAPYILVGLLALVAIIGGAMYFNGSHRTSNADVAAAPPAMERTITPSTQPGTPATPPSDAVKMTPAPSTTPAPSGAPSTTQQ